MALIAKVSLFLVSLALANPDSSANGSVPAVSISTPNAVFIHRNELLATIQDEGRKEDDVCRAIAAVPMMSPVTESAVDTLLMAMYHRGDKIGESAAYALAKIGRPAIPQIIDQLPYGDGSQMRYMLGALSMMPPDAQKELIPGLAALLHDPNPDSRRVSALSLGNLQYAGKLALPLLLESVHDPDGEVRALGARSIQRLNLSTAAAGAVPDLAFMLVHDEEPGRGFAASTLRNIGPPARAALVPLLRDASTQTVAYASMAMATISSGAVAGAAPLIEGLLHSANPTLRYDALQALKAMGAGARSAAPKIIAACRDPDLLVRISVMETLSSVDPDSPGTRAALQAGLADPQCNGSIAWELGRRGPAAGWAIPDLVKTMVRYAECSAVPSSNFAADALAKIGPDSVPALAKELKEGTNCTQAIAAWALGQVGPASQPTVPALTELTNSSVPSIREEAAGALDKIAPGWAQSLLGPDAPIEETEVRPASIENEIIPYLNRMLGSKDKERVERAREDIAYLKPSQPQNRRIAIDDRPPTVAPDIGVRFLPPDEKFHVGEPVNLQFEITTTKGGKYSRSSGDALRIISGTRIDSGGSEHPISVPVADLYRGGYAGSWLSSGPFDLSPSSPHRESDLLNGNFILDRPGKYRFVVDAVLESGTSTASRRSRDQAPQLVRSKSIVADVELLPRDEKASSRRLWKLIGDAMATKSWDDGFHEEWELGYLLDYRAIPALLHIIEVGGNSSRTTAAKHSLAYLCDKRRLRKMVLDDIEKNQRPRSEDGVEALAWVLAAAETIPCRAEESRSDVDYVRWDVARMQWEDKLQARLKARSRQPIQR